jgi:Zn-dependent M28 family amino/carboxypeptidase
MAKMRAYGLQNVHEEPWWLARGWRRGHASGEMVVPRRVPLQLSAYGWTGSTGDGGIVADLVASDPSPGAKGLAERAARWKGKIVMVLEGDASRSDRVAGFVNFGALVRAAEQAGAAALIRHDPRPGPFLHAEPVDFRGAGFRIPVLDIDQPQQAMLEGLLRQGERVRIHLDVRNEVSDGPVSSSNVVGEIRGRERPGRIVLVGAHIDSWDLATGAVDDGFGTAAVLGAARVLVDSGRAPRRTIRFVLFTGEEQGLLGSRAYIRAHRTEMAQLACALALDWGAGPIAAIPLAGHDEMREVFQRAADRLHGVQPIRVLDGYLGYTDAYAFTLAGVPGIGLFQDSPGYDAIGHSPADTLDKVDPRMLDRDVAVLALLALEVADAPHGIGDAWDAPTTARTLVRARQDVALRGLGMWPF